MSDEPRIKIAGLSISIRGREFPDATDYDDANWLVVDATCDAPGARVRVVGPALQVGDLIAFRDSCSKMLSAFNGSAVLEPLEPNLLVRLRFTDKSGHIEAEVDISPNHLEQQHRFTFSIDQSHLPAVLAACDEVLARYPLR